MGNVLTNLDAKWLSNGRIKQLCKEVHNKGSPYNHCFGFVDGTMKGICRPTYEQREVRHCLQCDEHTNHKNLLVL